MQYQKIKNLIISIFLIALFTVLGANHIRETGRSHELLQKTIDDRNSEGTFFPILCCKIGSHYQKSVKLSSQMWKRM